MNKESAEALLRAEECETWLRGFVQMGKEPFYYEKPVSRPNKQQLLAHLQAAIRLIDEINPSTMASILAIAALVGTGRRPIELENWHLIEVNDDEVTYAAITELAWALPDAIGLAIRRFRAAKSARSLRPSAITVPIEPSTSRVERPKGQQPHRVPDEA